MNFSNDTELLQEITKRANGIAAYAAHKSKDTVSRDDLAGDLILKAYTILKEKEFDSREHAIAYVIRSINNKKIHLVTLSYDDRTINSDAVDEYYGDSNPNTFVDINNTAKSAEDEYFDNIDSQADSIRKSNREDEVRNIFIEYGIEYDEDDRMASIRKLYDKVGKEKTCELLGVDEDDLGKAVCSESSDYKRHIRKALKQGYRDGKSVREYFRINNIPQPESIFSFRALISQTKKEMGIKRERHTSAKAEAREAIKKQPNMSLERFTELFGDRYKATSVSAIYLSIRKELGIRV